MTPAAGINSHHLHPAAGHKTSGAGLLDSAPETHPHEGRTVMESGTEDMDCLAWSRGMADLAARFRAITERKDVSRAERRYAAGRAKEATACSEIFARCATAEGPEFERLLKAGLRRGRAFRTHLDRLGGM